MTENLKDEGGTHIRVWVPPELADLGIAPDLQRFVDAMVYKLRRNAHKGRWSDLSLEGALKRLEGEVGELQGVLPRRSSIETLMEAADVANMALIIANISLEGRANGPPVPGV